MFFVNTPAQVAAVISPSESIIVPVWLMLALFAPLLALLFFFIANRRSKGSVNSNRALNFVGLAFIYAAVAGASETKLVASLINGAEGAEGRFNDHIIESGGTAGMFAVSGILTLVMLALFFILDQHILWRVILAVLFAVCALVLSRSSVDMQHFTDWWIYDGLQPIMNRIISGVQEFFSGHPVWIQA
jgi:hypothetical protein